MAALIGYGYTRPTANLACLLQNEVDLADHLLHGCIHFGGAIFSAQTRSDEVSALHFLYYVTVRCWVRTAPMHRLARGYLDRKPPMVTSMKSIAGSGTPLHSVSELNMLKIDSLG